MSSQPLLQAAPGKRIALPTRVEPKVFFANERTYLSWMSSATLISGLGVGLLNFSDARGRIAAIMFTFIGVAAMGYALYMFYWRGVQIRKRGQGGFDDRVGPFILCLAMVAAIVTNVVFRLTGGEGGIPKGGKGGL